MVKRKKYQITLDRSGRRGPLRWLSPIWLASVAYAIYVICWLLPPKVYADVMIEPNYMFLDLQSIIFVSLCYVFFWCGTKISKPSKFEGVVNRRMTQPHLIVGVLLFAVLLNAYSLYVLIGNNPQLLSYLISGSEDAEQIRNYLDYSAAFAESLPFLMAVLFWANFRKREYEIAMGSRSFLLTVFIFLASVFALVTCVLKLARYDLMPLLFGLWLSGTIVGLREKIVSKKALFFQATLLLALILSVFLLFSWLRGFQENGALIKSVFGYGPASYNRLTLVLDGQIRIPTMGTGVNAFPFLNQIPFLYRFVDFKDLLGLPPVDVARAAEFAAVGHSGLDAGYNWVSAFGSVFFDFSWFAVILFFLFGIFAKYSWIQVLRSRPFFVVVYPFVGFSILFWFGSNYFFRSSLFTWVAVGFMVAALEKMQMLRFRSR